MDRIQIANWFLTRRCNLRCSYCGIVKNYKNKPLEYPDMKYYYQNEMSTETVIRGLEKLKIHNEDCFHIFYGGEPMLREDLPEIINYCNNNNIHYTIITNNSPEVQDKIETLLSKVDFVAGLSSSVDPVFEDSLQDDRVKKSHYGMENLIKYKKYIKDLVAEITVSNDNVKYLYKLVKDLTREGINSSITFIDIAKTPYYDFSNVTDYSYLVKQNNLLKVQLDKIKNERLDVHMADKLIPAIWNILPSNLDCKFEDNLHNITIDADGSMRLCIRIRGVATPNTIKIDKIISSNGEVNPFFKKQIIKDKLKYCRLCNWTCPIMSNLIIKENNNDALIHAERRK